MEQVVALAAPGRQSFCWTKLERFWGPVETSEPEEPLPLSPYFSIPFLTLFLTYLCNVYPFIFLFIYFLDCLEVYYELRSSFEPPPFPVPLSLCVRFTLLRPRLR